MPINVEVFEEVLQGLKRQIYSPQVNSHYSKVKFSAICKLGNVSVRVGATCMHFVIATENIEKVRELGEFSRLLNESLDELKVKDTMLIGSPHLAGSG